MAKKVKVETGEVRIYNSEDYTDEELKALAKIAIARLGQVLGEPEIVEEIKSPSTFVLKAEFVRKND